MIAIKAFLSKLWLNVYAWISVAVGALVMLYRYKAQRAEKKAVTAKKEAEEAHQQAAGYEAVLEQRKTVESAVREVTERQKTDPPVDLKRPW